MVKGLFFFEITRNMRAKSLFQYKATSRKGVYKDLSLHSKIDIQ
jgi:hypothetical protein